MNGKFVWFFILSSILALMVGACAPALNQSGSAESYAPGGDFAADAGGAPAQEAMPAPPQAIITSEEGEPQGIDGNAAQRIVIFNANMAVVVDDVPGTVQTITQIATDLGGFVVYSNIYESGSYYTSEGYVTGRRADLTIRVPAERLEEVMEQIRAMSVRVNNESISGQDVTAEYTDLSSRLRNLEAARDQLERIMEDATDTEAVLAVYQELIRINGEIEVIQGQLNYLSEAAALSALSLTISSNIISEPIAPSPWNPNETVRRALRDLVYGLQNLVDLSIRTLICGSPLLIILIPLLLVLRFWWVRRQRRKAAQANPPADDTPKPSA